MHGEKSCCCTLSHSSQESVNYGLPKQADDYWQLSVVKCSNTFLNPFPAFLLPVSFGNEFHSQITWKKKIQTSFSCFKCIVWLFHFVLWEGMASIQVKKPYRLRWKMQEKWTITHLCFSSILHSSSISIKWFRDGKTRTAGCIQMWVLLGFVQLHDNSFCSVVSLFLKFLTFCLTSFCG